jgi:broad specificity phosphatase PhoE
MNEARPRILMVARHGTSLRNDLMQDQLFCPEGTAAQLRQYNDQQIPLTLQGEAEADELGRRLAETYGQFDVAYHSGARRSEQTMHRALKAMGQQPPPRIVCDVRLRERNSGYAYHMTKQEVDQRFPWFMDYWGSTGWFHSRPIGGESIADLWEGRVRAALEDICINHQTQRVAIFAHGRVNQVIRLLLENIPVNTRDCPIKTQPNCGYAGYQWIDGRFALNAIVP